MSTGASFRASMRFSAAQWACLLPRRLRRFLHFRFGRACGAEPGDARLVGLLDRTLWMNTARGVHRLVANRAHAPRRLRDHDHGLVVAHVVPADLARRMESERPSAMRSPGQKIGREVNRPAAVVLF
jgi:hypothetical protein